MVIYSQAACSRRFGETAVKLKQLVAATTAVLIVLSSWTTPAVAVPGWRFLRELFSGGEPEVGSPRSGIYTDIPYVIAPRKTAILNSTPQFQWNPVLNAASYTVILRGPDGILWEETGLEDNEITYPGVPALEPNVRYALTIRAEIEAESGAQSTIASTDEGIPGLSFYLLPEANLAQLNTDLEGNVAAALTALAAGLEKAQTYRDYNLMSEAIALLESLKENATAEDTTDSVALYRLLGELYLQVGLNTQARDAFTQAQTLALETANLGEQADVSAFLAYLALGTRERDKAIQLLNEAQTLYSDLGDEDKANATADWLATLSAN